MTPLRQRMIDDMQLRNLAPATQRNYIYHVARFASYYGLSPEKLDLEDASTTGNIRPKRSIRACPR